MTLERWQELDIGAVITRPGSMVEVETGSWSIMHPLVDMERCVHCMICWIFCPDSCFQVRNGMLVGVDYQHCKGCGICVAECPRKCIKMVEDIP